MVFLVCTKRGRLPVGEQCPWIGGLPDAGPKAAGAGGTQSAKL